MHFTDQTWGGPSYNGYTLTTGWTNNPSFPSGTMTSTLQISYPDDPGGDWSAGSVTKQITYQFDTGSTHVLVQKQNYDARTGTDDGAMPLAVSPGADVAAMPKTPAGDTPRLVLLTLTGSEVPADIPCGTREPSPENHWVWKLVSGNWSWVQDNSWDVTLEEAGPTSFKLTLVDDSGKPVTDGAFSVYRCPRGDHHTPNQSLAPCALDVVTSQNGAIASLPVNPNGAGDGGSRGYLGIELTKAPSNPGNYYVLVESLDKSYRIRRESQFAMGTGSDDEYRGGFLLCTVMGGEILDQNFQRFPNDTITVTQPTMAYLSYLSPNGSSPVTAALTSASQNGSTFDTSSAFALSQVGSSGVYMAPFTAVPDGYTGNVASGQPAIHIPLGGGILQAGQTTARSASVHALGVKALDNTFRLFAQTLTDFPPKLTLRFLQRNCLSTSDSCLTPLPTGDTDPSHAGTVQQTDIGDTSDNYAEIVNLVIRAENPFDWSNTAGDGNVGLTELLHQDYLVNSAVDLRAFYNGKNLSSLLDSTGMVATASGGRDYIHLASGRAVIQLKAVADARRLATDGSLVPPNGAAYYQGARGAQLQAIPIPQLQGGAGHVNPTASDVLAVNQWVDERSYQRRRTDPSKAWGTNDAPNQLRDWLEKKAWDVYSTWADDGTGEVDAACRIPTTLSENWQGAFAGLVNSNTPSLITFNPTALQLRHPLAPNYRWQKFYYGFDARAPEDGFPEVALHESRHCWQFTLKSRGETDADGDLLCAPSPTFPQTSSELLDGPNVAAPGGVNGDGHFKGDGPGLADTGEPVRTMLERNAQRYTLRLGPSVMTSVTCALSVFRVLAGDGQSGPAGQSLPQSLVVQVMQQGKDASGNIADVAAPGVTIRFTVPTGSTAMVNGVSDTFVMTDDNGQVSVALTNGAADTTLQVTLLPPMAPQNVCSTLNVSQIPVSLHVQ